MLYDNEIVMLILGSAVFLFVQLNLAKIGRITSWKWLMLAFYLLMAGWLFTVLEGVFMEYYFNILEHVSYALSALAMAIWCRMATLAGKGEVQK
jgi:hypothetical protein